MITSLLISWFIINHYPSYSSFSDAFSVSNDMATCTFPQSHYPAFLVCTQSQSFNLSNSTISATFTVECDSNTIIRFAGQDVWNLGSRPASARLFFSSVIGYNNLGTGSTNYWFKTSYVEIDTNTQVLTLTAIMDDPLDWSDAGGCNDCPPTTIDNFWYAVSNIHEIGLAFGGGSFYDVGIATISGNCIFHLNSFSVSPKFKNYRQCFSSE